MKRYLSFVGLLTLCLMLGYYFYYFDGSLYLSHQKDQTNLNINFKTQNRQIMQVKDGQDTPFLVKGVDLESSYPGYHHNEFAIGKKRYQEWLDQIAEMGANTIRVKTLMDVAFYDALHAHNQKNPKHPLYLIQGVRIDDYRNNQAISGSDNRYIGQLLRDARAAVDIIHGRRQFWNTDFGIRNYTKDISKWVLGFVVGENWNSGMIVYTNHQENAKSVKGNYFQTTDKTTTFESLLAEVMEDLVSYESAKYQCQHLVSFANSPGTDPFVYREAFEAQAPKFARLNVENIKTTAALKSGVFAAYSLLDCHPEFSHYLDIGQSGISEDLKQSVDGLPFMEAYVKLLAGFHQLPVLITGYGHSTARGTDLHRDANQPLTMNEREQGEALVRDFIMFKEAGLAGATIHAWQDDWNARSWNVSYATNRHASYQWGDVQVRNQGFGLLTFDEGERPHTIDGSLDEWSKKPNMKTKDGKLWLDSDSRYLYIAIQTTEASNGDYFIPIDTHPEIGSRTWEKTSPVLDRLANFILSFRDGEGHLYVQERYDSVRSHYMMQLEGDDPHIEPPRKDSSHFVPIRMVLRNDRIFEDLEKTPREEKWLPAYDTGQLKQGYGKRGSASFDSRADYYVNGTTIEARIPWQMLNFSNPSEGFIHDDYYRHYGVKDKKIDKLYVGLGRSLQQGTVKMKPYTLKQWQRPQVVPVLKESYAMVKELWTKEGD
ncbi:hypothetical protein [Streptococcus merionis]|uniref:hypothetical protein n=1 Tax=Streptococcus merionis TaxID=400065 RepID=UPI0026EFC78A|nr:hypothetical protein [Streptococcus merionis]